MRAAAALAGALLVGLAGASAASRTIAPSTPDPERLTPLAWRSIGPFRGGRALAVTGVAGDPLHFYFGAVNGGVWETRDAGRTWTPIFDGQATGSIGAITVAPSDSRTLYVGTGESDMRSDIAQGAGMFRSSDGGASWTRIGLEASQQIARILVDPARPATLLVAALGHPYGPNAERGVFRSTDGGRSWTRTLHIDDDTGAIDLAFKPGDPSTVYAALWQTRRPPWNVYAPSSGPGGGLYRSRDGGVTWTRLADGFPEPTGRIGLGVARSDPGRLYALVDGAANTAAGGLWRSDDDGDSWRKINGDKRIWERGWYFGELTVDPANPDRLWVMDTVVLVSDDAGRSFRPIKGEPTGDD
ncbi:MAG: hypothetical protein JOZ27_08300, partial [Caulobacteraceae bacterium]|nr:hypothetical protein [Caulobacteraceae bacterium]